MREEWIALAERIEKATGPDREIDKAIVAALGYSWRGMAYWDNATSTKTLPGTVLYAGSLDAITALIEREFPNNKWAARRLEIGAKAMLDPIPAKDKIDPALRTAIYADAETPALALCVVFCRAMAERVPKT